MPIKKAVDTKKQSKPTMPTKKLADTKKQTKPLKSTKETPKKVTPKQTKKRVVKKQKGGDDPNENGAVYVSAPSNSKGNSNSLLSFPQPLYNYDIKHLKLPSPLEGSLPEFDKKLFGEKFTSGNEVAKVQIYKCEAGKILDALKSYNIEGHSLIDEKLSEPIGLSELKKEFMSPNRSDTVIVKVSPVYRYETLYRCLREPLMAYNLYTAVGTDEDGKEIKGESICSAPYAYGLVWNDSQWKFVFVQQYIKGTILSKPALLPLFSFSYKTYFDQLMNACNTLWCLGYLHNDLKLDNVMQDDKEENVYFIDMELSTKTGDKFIEEYKKLRREAKQKYLAMKAQNIHEFCRLNTNTQTSQASEVSSAIQTIARFYETYSVPLDESYKFSVHSGRLAETNYEYFDSMNIVNPNSEFLPKLNKRFLRKN